MTRKQERLGMQKLLCEVAWRERPASVGMELTDPSSLALCRGAGASFHCCNDSGHVRQTHHCSCRLQLCRWYVLLAFCLSRLARDEDTDGHGTDDDDHIADDDVDDVADV